MDKRIIEKHFNDNKLDGIFIMSDYNRFWYTGVQSSYGFLMIDPNESQLFVDGRYIIHAKDVGQNAKVNLLKGDSLQQWAKNTNYKKIGFESDYTTIDQLNFVKNLFPNAELIGINGQELRSYKTQNESDRIREAAQIGLKAFEELKKEIVPGKTEKELAAKLEFLFIKHGATKFGFDTIVASGVNGAKPHAVPSDKKLLEGEFCTFDFGTIYKGYMSDTTRTIQVGEVTNEKLLEIYSIVKEAQRLGIDSIKPGVTGASIDKICREYIKSKGYGEYFTHGTGHGLGIEVHELPNTNSANETILEEGHVVTVEPGIYIDGIGGVRIEDDILVTKDGYEILSKDPE